MTYYRPFALCFGLILAYSLCHALWVSDHPPMWNDDHFNTRVTLTQFQNPALYPADLTWSNQRLGRSYGFLFVGLLQFSEQLYGDYLQAAGFWALVFHLVYLSGFYLFFWELLGLEGKGLLTLRHGLALTLALMSTLPIYMYISFANWGVTSVYAHGFVTIITGWLFYLWLRLAKGEGPWWAWGLFGAVVAMSIYLNPVKGSGLVAFLALMLLGGAIAQPARWPRLAAYLGGVALPLLAFIWNYTQQRAAPPTDPATFEAAQQYMIVLNAHRIYPWVLPERAAPFLIAFALLMGLAYVCLHQKWAGERLFYLVTVVSQLTLGYFLMGHPIFLIGLGYWGFRLWQGRVDDWDRQFLLLLCAVNLFGPVLSALTQYLWVEHDLAFAYTFVYEQVRLTRYALLPLYVFLLRWLYELLRDPGRDGLRALAALCLFAGAYSIFGSANPVKDHPILMKTLLPIRWALPLFAFALIYLADSGRASPRWLGRAAWGGFLALGGGFFVGMSPWQNLSPWAYPILALGLALGAWLWLESARPGWQNGALYGFFVLSLAWPLAGYHQATPDINWCDPPFLNYCSPEAEVRAAGDWFQKNTALDESIFVIGLQPERFISLAERSTVHVNYWQIYNFQGAAALMAALPIGEQLAGTNPLRADYRGDAYLMQTLATLGTDYIIVFGGGYRFDLPIAYESPQAIIYRLETVP
jgi:hypothetical protein